MDAQITTMEEAAPAEAPAQAIDLRCPNCQSVNVQPWPDGWNRCRHCGNLWHDTAPTAQDEL